MVKRHKQIIEGSIYSLKTIMLMTILDVFWSMLNYVSYKGWQVLSETSQNTNLFALVE